METSFIELDTNFRIAYRLRGKAHSPVVLICHGLGANQTQFEEDAKWLSESYRVITVDLRGHGESGSPVNLHRDTFTLPLMAQDIWAVLDAENIDSVHFVGNSLGGVVGLEMIKQQPERIQSFSSFGTTYDLDFPTWVVWMKIFTYALIVRFMDFPAFVAKHSSENAAAQDLIREMYKITSRKVTHCIDWNIHKYSYSDVLRSYEKPILLIRGDRDNEINKELDKCLGNIKGLKNFREIWIPNTGHFSNLDSPNEVRYALSTFIGEQS